MIKLYNNKCENILKTIETSSIDFIFTDPPYPNIKRNYGVLTEEQWHQLMQLVVMESKRILKPSGSMVILIQPNSEKIGRMRLWAWEFLLWAAKSWNLVQDCYYWNTSAIPTVHTQEKNGLMRPSIKYCIWLGNPDCYRNQQEILWQESDAQKAERLRGRCDNSKSPSGHSNNRQRTYKSVERRGGVTPFNIILGGNSDAHGSSGSFGHGAGTPLFLCERWIRYLSKENDTVLDPFSGLGTVGLACQNLNRSYIGIEVVESYHNLTKKRLGVEL